MISNRLKLAAGAVLLLLVVASFVAVKQGTSDANAKKLLAENLRTQRAVEDARIERIRQINHVNAAQCASLANLYSIIRLTLEQSDKSIDQITYYRSHPLERQRAHLQNALTLAKFRTPPCPRDISLPNKPIIDGH